MSTITTVIRDVVCEILLKDIENLLEKYMLRTRKVKNYRVLLQYDLNDNMLAFVNDDRVTVVCIGTKTTSPATNKSLSSSFIKSFSRLVVVVVSNNDFLVVGIRHYTVVIIRYIRLHYLPFYKPFLLLHNHGYSKSSKHTIISRKSERNPRNEGFPSYFQENCANRI